MRGFRSKQPLSINKGFMVRKGAERLDLDTICQIYIAHHHFFLPF